MSSPFANPGEATPASETQTQHHRFPLPPETRQFRPSHDNYGRYVLPNPEAGAEGTKSYTRVTTGAKTLEDTSGLEKWKIKSVLRGLKTNPHLLEDVDLYADPWEVDKALLAAAEKAHVAAGGVRASEFGTALHAWLEALELGTITWDQVPDQFKPYCAKYGEALVLHGLKAAVDKDGRPLVERIVYNPDTGWVGTFDRIYELGDGSLAIGDVKTSKERSIDYSWLAISIQLGDYAGSPLMLSLDGTEWEPMPPVRQDYAIVAHVPSDADPAKATMVTVDLECGRLAMEAAVRVRHMRSVAKSAIPNVHTIPAPGSAKSGLDSLRTLVSTCTSRQQLAETYEAYSEHWTDELTELGNAVLARRGVA